jgi:hypothetical protein
MVENSALNLAKQTVSKTVLFENKGEHTSASETRSAMQQD